jgi:hypothetical protein
MFKVKIFKKSFIFFLGWLLLMFFFRDHFLFGSSFIYRPPVFHTIDRIARVPTTKQNQKKTKEKRDGTGRPDLARLRRNKNKITKTKKSF